MHLLVALPVFTGLPCHDRFLTRVFDGMISLQLAWGEQTFRQHPRNGLIEGIAEFVCYI